MAQHAVITGGGTGIGRATGELLTQRGWSVTAIGLARDDDLPAGIAFVEADVTSSEALDGALTGDEAVHALVNCVGIIKPEREWEPTVFEEVLKINLMSAFMVSGALVDRSRRRSWSWRRWERRCSARRVPTQGRRMREGTARRRRESSATLPPCS